jgi:hypothetical protein
MILPNFPGPSLGDIIYRIALSIFPVARISFNVDPLPHALFKNHGNLLEWMF